MNLVVRAQGMSALITPVALGLLAFAGSAVELWLVASLALLPFSESALLLLPRGR